MKEKESWRKRIWVWLRQLWSAWKLIVGLILFTFVASVPIFVMALVAAALWYAGSKPVIEWFAARVTADAGQQQQFEYAVNQLADWAWRILLLGAFAALIYERIKRHEELGSKREAIRSQVRHVIATENWNVLDDLYQELNDLGSESQNQELRREMAAAFYQRTVNPKAADWNMAYAPAKGWLAIAKNLDPTNEDVGRLLEFDRNVKGAQQDQFASVESCISGLAPEILGDFILYHREDIRFGVKKNAALESILKQTVLEKKPHHQKYILWYILQEPSATEELRQYLKDRGIDKVFFLGGALRGVTELEPEKLAQFHPSQIAPGAKAPRLEPLSCVTDFVEPGTRPKHLFVVGATGNGKTFLNRQIEYWTRKIEPRWIFLQWTSFMPLMEEGQRSVSLILRTFVGDMRAALERDEERFREITRTKDWTRSSDWREQLVHLKEILQSEEIEGIFVSLDNLDKYPELRRDDTFLESLVTALLRPEIMEFPPKCYLRLFMEPVMYKLLDRSKSPWIFFESLHLEWQIKQKQEILNLRVGAIQQLGVELISEKDIGDISEKANTARELILQLQAYYSQDQSAYAQERKQDSAFAASSV